MLTKEQLIDELAELGLAELLDKSLLRGRGDTGD